MADDKINLVEEDEFFFMLDGVVFTFRIKDRRPNSKQYGHGVCFSYETMKGQEDRRERIKTTIADAVMRVVDRYFDERAREAKE